MFERTKKIRESFWFWLFLTILSIVGFAGSTIGFLSNTSITGRARVVYFGLVGLLLLLVILLAIAAYSAWLQRRINATIDTRIQQLLTDPQWLTQTDADTTELIHSFLSKSKTQIVDEPRRRFEEAIATHPINPLEVIRASHLENVYEAFKNNARAYGVFYEFQNIHCFVNEDGLVRITRHAKLTAYTSMSEFYVYLLLPEKDTEGVLVPPHIECIGDSRNLDVGAPVSFRSRLMSTIQIHPPLKPGDSVEFRLYEGSKTQVFRTPWLRKKSQTRDDYVFWDITYPTRQLKITVNLPQGMEIMDTTVDAVYSFSGQTRTRHVQEYDRVRDSVVDIGEGNHVLCLMVDRPLLSVNYKLGWLPQADYAEPEP